VAYVNRTREGQTVSADWRRDYGPGGRENRVNEVVSKGRSKERAAELAVQIAKLDPIGVQMTKRALNEWVQMFWGPIFKHALGLEVVHFPVAAYEERRKERQDSQE
jgi:hypothetical protein